MWKKSFFEYFLSLLLGWVLIGMSSYTWKWKVWCFYKCFTPTMNIFRLILMESWIHKFCVFFFRKFVGPWLFEWISTLRWYWCDVWYWECGKDDVTSFQLILSTITRCFRCCTLEYLKNLIFTKFHVWVPLLP